MKESIVLFYDPDDKPVPEKFKDKTKTHAEFLEELKIKLKTQMDDDSFTINWRSCCYEYYTLIEQFEAQLRGITGDVDE